MRLKLCNSVSKVMCFCSRNRYYVNSKVGEVMEKRLRSLMDDILVLRNAINILDALIEVTDDDNLLDVMYHARSELKILVYDLEECS